MTTSRRRRTLGLADQSERRERGSRATLARRNPDRKDRAALTTPKKTAETSPREGEGVSNRTRTHPRHAQPRQEPGGTGHVEGEEARHPTRAQTHAKISQEWGEGLARTPSEEGVEMAIDGMNNQKALDINDISAEHYAHLSAENRQLLATAIQRSWENEQADSNWGKC